VYDCRLLSRGHGSVSFHPPSPPPHLTFSPPNPPCIIVGFFLPVLVLFHLVPFISLFADSCPTQQVELDVFLSSLTPFTFRVSPLVAFFHPYEAFLFSVTSLPFSPIICAACSGLELSKESSISPHFSSPSPSLFAYNVFPSPFFPLMSLLPLPLPSFSQFAVPGPLCPPPPPPLPPPNQRGSKWTDFLFFLYPAWSPLLSPFFPVALQLLFTAFSPGVHPPGFLFQKSILISSNFLFLLLVIVSKTALELF